MLSLAHLYQESPLPCHNLLENYQVSKGVFLCTFAHVCLRVCLVRVKYALIKGLIQSISPKFSTVAHLKVKGNF